MTDYLDGDASVGFYLDSGDTVAVRWTGRPLGAPDERTTTLDTVTLGTRLADCPPHEWTVWHFREASPAVCGGAPVPCVVTDRRVRCGHTRLRFRSQSLRNHPAETKDSDCGWRIDITFVTAPMRRRVIALSPGPNGPPSQSTLVAVVGYRSNSAWSVPVMIRWPVGPPVGPTHY